MSTKKKVYVSILVILGIVAMLGFVHWYYEVNLLTALNILKTRIAQVLVASKIWIVKAIFFLKAQWLELLIFMKALTWKRGWVLVWTFIRKSLVIKGKQMAGVLFITGLLANKKRKSWFNRLTGQAMAIAKKALKFIGALYTALHIGFKIFIAILIFALSFLLFSVDGLFAYLPKGTFKWVGGLLTKFVEKFGIRTFLDSVFTFLFPSFVRNGWDKIKNKFFIKNIVKADEVATEQLEVAVKMTKNTINDITQSKIIQGSTRQIGKATAVITNNKAVKVSSKLAVNASTAIAGSIGAGFEMVSNKSQEIAKKGKIKKERRERRKAHKRKSWARKTRVSRRPCQLKKRHLQKIQKQSRRKNR